MWIVLLLTSMLKIIRLKSNLNVIDNNNKVDGSSNSSKVNRGEKNKSTKKNRLKTTNFEILLRPKNQDFSFKFRNIGL